MPGAIPAITALTTFDDGTGPALYAAMGLAGRSVEMAVLYGAVMFGGSVLVWLMNLLANVSRGAGKGGRGCDQAGPRRWPGAGCPRRDPGGSQGRG